jgi:SAM-dependent methyltransferase
MMFSDNNAVKVFDRIASFYNEKFSDVSLYHEPLEVFLQHLRGKDLLELGSGPANISRFLLAEDPELNVLATDLAPAMLELAAAPGIRTMLLDCRNVSSLKEQFDGIICGFAFPYINREEVAIVIKGAAERLKTEGLFYLSTMEGPYNSSGKQTNSLGDVVDMYFHEFSFLEECLMNNDLSIISTQRFPNVSAGKPVTDLVIVAKLK